MSYPDFNAENTIQDLYASFLDYAVLGDYVHAQECIKNMWLWDKELAKKMEEQIGNLEVKYLHSKCELYV